MVNFLEYIVSDYTFVIGCLFWPLWSACVLGLFGRFLGNVMCGYFAVSSLFITATLAIIAFILIGTQKSKVIIPLFLCFKLGVPYFADLTTVHLIFDSSKACFLKQEVFSATYEVHWGLLFDSLTITMLVVITVISALVHLYAFSYMQEDPHLPRFFACLSLFTFFMLVLVTADNYFQLFVGWEGVGLCSYLLITFWYTRLQANKSALQALVVNKVGDVALVLALLLLFILYGNTQFETIFLTSSLNKLLFGFYVGPWYFCLGEVIGILFFIGAVAKSAQIGLHTWLLSAMEGPTPVSALLHAATMVTAGMFLVIRSAPIWPFAPTSLFLMTIWGALTAFFAATCGLVQHDIKKIIAFSTCSQLGYMFYACGLGNFTASLYHLTNHAFFKALLFMGAGAVIHTLQGEQDLRRMGGLAQVMPLTYVAMLLASLSLLGFPFLSGFYSKDILIELAWAHYTIHGTFAFWLATFAAFLTAFYSTRLLYYVFLSNTNSYKHVLKNAHEADQTMLWSFRPLIIGSLFTGYFLRSIFVGFDSTFYLSANLLTVDSLNFLIDSEFLPYFIKLIPVVFSFLGVFLALFIYTNKMNTFNTLIQYQYYNRYVRQIHFFFMKKWYFDIIYNRYIATNIYALGSFLYRNGDQGLLEFVGPQGIYNFLSTFVVKKNFNPTIYYNLILSGVTILIVLMFLISLF
jgi:proton-translocating NADH-quinone oxidoreductase chain L